MNSYFNATRFGKYFLFDLKQNMRNAWIIILSIILSPALLFLIDKILIMFGYGPIIRGLKDSMYAIMAIIGILCLPAEAYGHLTDRKRGAQWALIPASTFEKWLSMSLITCIIYPIFISVPVIAFFRDQSLNMGNFFNLGPEELKFNLGAFLILCVIVNLLYFLLGALIFKKGKVGKSWLVAFGAQCILSALFVFTIDKVGDTLWFERIMESVSLWPDEKIISVINIAFNACFTVAIGGLLAGNYFRVKSIKY